MNARLRLQGALEEEIEWLRRLLPNGGAVAIDIGANIGLYSYHLSQICSRVEAFEPNRGCLDILEAYGARNIYSHCVALSSSSGTMLLNIPIVDGVLQHGLGSVREYPEGEVTAIEVPKRTLDEYQIKNVSFIKIDVEGHESEVLAGAETTIRQDHPVLLVEIEERHQVAPIESIFDVFLALGYRGYFLFQGKLLPLAQFDVEFHQRGYIKGRQHIKYVNNFFFLTRDVA